MGDKQTLEFRYVSSLQSGTNRVLELRRGKLIEQNRSPHWRWKYWSFGNIGGWSYRRFHCSHNWDQVAGVSREAEDWELDKADDFDVCVDIVEASVP